MIIRTWRWLFTWDMVSPFTSIICKIIFGVAPATTTTSHESLYLSLSLSLSPSFWVCVGVWTWNGSLTVFSSEPLDGMHEALVKIGRPAEARHFRSDIRPDSQRPFGWTMVGPRRPGHPHVGMPHQYTLMRGTVGFVEGSLNFFNPLHFFLNIRREGEREGGGWKWKGISTGETVVTFVPFCSLLRPLKARLDLLEFWAFCIRKRDTPHWISDLQPLQKLSAHHPNIKHLFHFP